MTANDQSLSTGELTVVFVSHGSIPMILDNHRALLEGGRFPVKVVENDSRAADVEMAAFPSVEVIRPGLNLGYGRAANLVLRTSGSPYVLLLNPDLTAPVEEIAKLLAAARKFSPPAAISAPATRGSDHLPGAATREVAWLSGCAMLFDVAAIREVGLFDENIFLYSEDTELCQRAAAAGRRMMFCPHIHFPHLEGKSTEANSALERLRWWHFGWSNCYRMTKHHSTSWWRNPRRKMWGWRLQSLLARSSEKRLKWRAKADGARAFLAGEKAFGSDGRPKQSPASQAPPSE